jgi:hypothetical protein
MSMETGRGVANPREDPEKPRWFERRAATLGWGLVALGALLRVRQYLSNRSLWLDESLISLNVIHRDAAQLLQPLDYHQQAPLGFLLVERLAVRFLGSAEWALRLFPLLAAIASLFLFRSVARRAVGPLAGAVALALFAVSAPLTYYASEVKQYSSDVAGALLLIAVGLPALEERLSPARAAILAATGALAIWFSHPALFVLAGIGLCVLVSRLRQGDRAGLRAILFAGAVWALSFAANWVLLLRRTESETDLVRYWQGEFAPLLPASVSDARWFVGKFFQIFSNPSGLVGPTAGVGALSFLVACAVGFRPRRLRLALLLAPVLFALVASGLHRYPFVGRFLLFAVPLLLLVVGEGAERVASATGRRSAAAIGAILIALLLFLPAARAAEGLVSPQTHHEVRPVLAYVRQHAAAGDLLYGYRSSPVFVYYLPRFGFDAGRYVGGSGFKDDWPGYARDLQALRGRGRVWIVFSGISEKEANGTVPFYLYLLDGFGTRLDTVKAPGSAAYLYDLSRPAPPGG